MYSRCVRVCVIPQVLFFLQILCLAEQILFTERCEQAITTHTLSELLIELESQLEAYTSTERLSSTSVEDTDSNVLELKLKSLILDTIHFIDVVHVLIDGTITVSSVGDWLWQKQLRFYVNHGKCIMKMVDAEFNYTYEYQGNAAKLVHTPLTDKCYLTLTQGEGVKSGTVAMILQVLTI